MCGLSFIWRRGAGAPELERAIQKMTAAQRHRGPDVTRDVLGDGFAIGHNRLRVVDLDPRADQPFQASGRSELLAYNGEIYNARDLRAELSRDGIELRTSSDTEILYHLLCRHGLGALDRIHGMFAFVFYRPDAGEVVLARDRMGIKPLHFAVTGNTIVASSEIKGVLASGFFPIALDREGVLQVFRYNHTLGERTVFRGVRALPPGSSLQVSLPGLKLTQRRYFRPTLRSPRFASFNDRANDLDLRFREAVRSHLAADVPVACYMSGGLDSCGIAAEASVATGGRLSTYSMVFPGSSFSEEPQIDRVARDLAVKNTKIPIDGASLDDLSEYIMSAEMPQWWTSDLALKKLGARVAEEGIKVVLAGEGPDELLAGYDAYRAMKLRRPLEALGLTRLARVGALRRGVLRALLPWIRLDLSAVQHYLDRHAPSRRADLTRAYGFYPENIAVWESISTAMRHVLTPDAALAESASAEDDQAFFRREVGDHAGHRSTLDANTYLEVAVRLPSWILHMGDRMSAAHGLELRFPYLDDAVVESMLALPETDRLRGFDEKHILKHVHSRRLPRHVLRRHKQPLYTPILGWIRGALTDERLERYWSRPLFDEIGIFERDACEALRRRLVRGELDGDLDTMLSEWAFMMVLSTHILAVGMKDLTA